MRNLRSSMLWKCLCLAMYVPVMMPGVLDSPMYCVDESGRVAVEDSRDSHCPLAATPVPHGCCAQEAADARHFENSCHCGPCIDIQVPVDQNVVQAPEVSPEPEVHFLAHSSVEWLSSDKSSREIRTRPPPGQPLFTTSIRTVVLLS